MSYVDKIVTEIEYNGVHTFGMSYEDAKAYAVRLVDKFSEAIRADERKKCESELEQYRRNVIASLEQIQNGFGTLDEYIEQMKGEQP